MRAVTADEMKSIDRYTVEEMGISSIVLMENAARAVADACEEEIDGEVSKQILVFCGKGNNGGDGFAIARILHDSGYKVKIVFFDSPDSVRGDARANLNIDLNIGIEIIKSIVALKIEIKSSILLVDALLGIGLKRDISGVYREAIELINNFQGKIISVDIPSGVNSDNGLIMGCAVKAKRTVTFAMVKVGMLVYPGTAYCGKITIANISIQRKTIEKMDIKVGYLSPSDLQRLIPKRESRTNKGNYGRLFVMAGSKNMTGAAVLCCRAGYRAGAGVVHACMVESGISVIKTLIPEVVSIPLSEYEGKVCLDSFDDISKTIRDATVIAIGPGLGESEDVREFVYAVLKNAKVPIIIDADALNAVSMNIDILQETKRRAIVTPHPREMSRLTGLPVKEILNNMVETARSFAKKYNVTTVLKDARTIVAHPDGRICINVTGNPAMAKGGSGDVLTGIIGALLAQGMDTFQAASVGAYIHGYAGDLAAKSLGDYGVLAGEIADFVSMAIKSFTKIE